jgi:hypothetical protein
MIVSTEGALLRPCGSTGRGACRNSSWLTISLCERVRSISGSDADAIERWWSLAYAPSAVARTASLSTHVLQQTRSVVVPRPRAATGGKPETLGNSLWIRRSVYSGTWLRLLFIRALIRRQHTYESSCPGEHQSAARHADWSCGRSTH